MNEFLLIWFISYKKRLKKYVPTYRGTYIPTTVLQVSTKVHNKIQVPDNEDE